MLAKLLSQLEGGSGSSSGIKCVPSYVAPDLASAIRRHVSQALRQRKGSVPCYYISELATYTLPPGITFIFLISSNSQCPELLQNDC